MKTIFGEINLALLDCSGVISDDRRPVFRCSQLIAESQGRAYDVSFEEAFVSGRTFDEFLRSVGIELDELFDRQAIFRKYYELACAEGITPIIVPGIVPFLISIREKGVPMIVISAHLQEFLEREIESYHITSFFKELKGSTGEEKALVIKKLCRELKVDPSETIFFGDMTFDVRSGKKAGVHTVAITTGYHTEEMLRAENPDILAESLVEAYLSLEIE